ncbi:MAG TPA: ABC transporter ATP-binding protein [Candidatus Lustribacter sp.]|nr:ABC transporter ATP-binding protein [Candidatus Lustribacter sp.]
MNGPLISLDGLTKRYGNVTAVDDVSLDVAAGSICGLLGPNGAGKTTTFKCLLGFAKPSAGRIAIEGAPLTPATFETLAYVPERASLYDNLTIADHLTLYRRSYKHYDDVRAHELLALFSLDPKQKAKRLSKGMRTAAALTLAFSIRPRVLILDEPSSGLDPVHQRHVLDLMIDAAANGASVLFSSHQVGQVERAADSVAIMKKGKLIVSSVIDDLKSGEKVIEAVFAGPIPDLGDLASDPRVVRLEQNGSMLRAVTRDDSDGIAARIFALHPKSIRTIDLNLEEIFMNAVSEVTL